MPWTNESLHELCKDHLQKPWWPSLVGWEEDHFFCYWFLPYMSKPNPSRLGASDAADLILGRAMRWLVANSECQSASLDANPDGGFRVVTWIVRGRHPTGPTELAAILATCAATESAVSTPPKE